MASAFGAATNPRRHRSRRQPALQLPFPGADHIQRETVAAGRRAAEILLAAMPVAAGPGDPRIVGEVWPLELIARESHPGVVALAPFGQASAPNPGSRRRPTMKLGAEPMETPRFGAIAAVSRSRSTWWSIQAHCQRSYVRVKILTGRMKIFDPREGRTTCSIRPFPNSGSICATRTSRAGNPIQLSNFW